MSHASPAQKGRMLVRRGCRPDKSPRVVGSIPSPRDGTVCSGCEAVFHHKTWRCRRLTPARLSAPRELCPACRQVRSHRAFGEVVLRGSEVERQREAILRRIHNIADRAAFTQPERRIVAIERRADGVHVLTTSQKLAHRVAVELAKAFGGRARYAWTDRAGRLYSVWEPGEHRAPGRGGGR
jgi:NMD protein affecting ribosome stability and mRNA decay